MPLARQGFQPKKGPRQPTPAQTLANPGTRWGTIEVAWYDGETRIFDAVSQTALWHRDSFDPVPLRSRLAPGSNGEAETDEAASPEQIVNRYILRWNIEVTFQKARLHLGIETQRNWPTPGLTPDLANSPRYEDPALAALLKIACYAA